MGIGKLGGFQLLRFRWTFHWFEKTTAEDGREIETQMPPVFVKLKNRPVREETELDFIDVTKNRSENSVTFTLYDDCQSARNFETTLKEPIKKWTGVLTLCDGTGQMLETWTLIGAWTQEMKFLEEGAEFTVRFDKAEFSRKNNEKKSK